MPDLTNRTTDLEPIDLVLRVIRLALPGARLAAAVRRGVGVFTKAFSLPGPQAAGLAALVAGAAYWAFAYRLMPALHRLEEQLVAAGAEERDD